MHNGRCSAGFVIAAMVCALAATFAVRARGQDDVWQVVRADYGYRDQRTDVTGLLLDLISRGGVRGRIAVNNQTMGGDPAVGRDKTLRIFARNRRNQQREFDYNEGSSFDVSLFSARNDDWDNRGGNYAPGDRDRYNQGGSWIIRGFYGVQGRTANVTDLLRSMARDGRLTVDVSNSNMGGDPAPGPDKVLIVIYRADGREQATAVREGHTLSIP